VGYHLENKVFGGSLTVVAQPGLKFHP